MPLGGKMKRILVVDTAASEGGALTVLQDFYKAVATSSMDLEWIFLVSGPYVEEKDNIRVIVNPSLKNHLKTHFLNILNIQNQENTMGKRFLISSILVITMRLESSVVNKL